MTSWRLGRAASAVALLLLVGCGQKEEFQPRAETASLIPEARAAVTDLMIQSFGTVATPVAWEKLPIEFHGAKGTVSRVGDSPTTFQLEIDYQTAPIEPGQGVAWVSGENAPELRTVTKWDAAAGLLTVDEPLAMPVDGDEVAIHPGAHLAEGLKVHRQHCHQCHGPTGRGDGPTARSMNPKPRDYRDGTFKYTSTAAGRKGSRADLMRTLNHGIPGSYMPSYRLLPTASKRAVIEYVRWLAMRGEVEKDVSFVLALDYKAADIAESEDAEEILAEFAEYAEEDLRFDFDDSASFAAQKWQAGELPTGVVEPSVDRPASTAESLARGKELYLSAQVKCASCHGDTGLGNGPSNNDVQNGPDGEPYDRPGFHDMWGNLSPPRNFVRGVYRGGDRPIDLFRRIAVGVKGTAMPGYSTMLDEKQVWDLVNYIISLREMDAEIQQASASNPRRES